ncbi:MAG TPA: 4-hydroxythreonine-4-phosphate dehydrogenase PdxA [Methylomirabilota bacterium]|jgi:4-hydroxythreonine-4-phosphate dehydrogenase|nr:4-hydroxythreonine-4-phosphate dehydrogenase PdxA [Methylomirabilota bacterium]
MSADGRPRLAFMIGDPTGIGPELVAKTWADPAVRAACRPVAVGDARVVARALALVKAPLELVTVTGVAQCGFGAGQLEILDVPNADPDAIPPGRVDTRAGQATLESLEVAVDLARAGQVAGVVYAPLNKQAMHEAGSPHPDELHLVAEWCKAAPGSFGEINVVDQLWCGRVTSHIGLARVAAGLTVPAILEAVRLLARVQRQAGLARPRIGVAALNPHGGEGGMFGPEEAAVIRPAVEAARADGIDARGPFPADTIFVRARRGELDGIVSLYHDQAQIALKLLGFERGVTVGGGLPIVLATPAHGTAHDIAGRGVADPGAFRRAVEVASQLAAGRGGRSR